MKKMRNIYLLIKAFAFLFGLTGWIIWLNIINIALENDGYVTLDLVSENEMVFEFFLVLFIICYILTIMIYELIITFKGLK